MKLTLRRGSILVALLSAALIIPLAACSSPQMTAPGVIDGGFGGEGSSSAADGGAVSPEGVAPGSDTGLSGRSVIRSGNIAVEVQDPAAAADDAVDIAEDLGGYVESKTVDHAEGRDRSSAHLTVRVPADRLDEALAELGGLGNVKSQTQSASDVTAQHVDLQARVKALQASVDRLTELMAGSATTSELLEAESALSQRQQELDGLTAQLQSLEGLVNEASISISLGTKNVLPGGPSNFWEGLVAGWDSLVAAGAGALVLFGVLLPWLVIAGVVALGVVLIVRGARRAGRRKSGGDGVG